MRSLDRSLRQSCESAWNDDPPGAVIGIENKGAKRRARLHIARSHNGVGKKFVEKEKGLDFYIQPLVFLWRAREDSNPRPIA